VRHLQWDVLWFSVSKVRIISGGFVELVGPSVDDRMSIDVVDGSHDALLESCFEATRIPAAMPS
jgi:hypothetical protein